MFDLKPGEEAHFYVNVGGGELRFIQRPISTPAKEGTIGFLDGVDAKGRVRREVAVFKDGEWRGGRGGAKLKITPRVWTVFAPTAAEANAARGEVGHGR